MTYTNLTEEQLQAVRQFAECYGYQWKSALRRVWQRNVVSILSIDFDHMQSLRGLRKTHGQVWLTNFKLS